MSFTFSDIFKIPDVKTRYVFCAWVFGALVVFLPPTIQQQMAITVPDAVRPWLGFGTLAAFVIWLVLVALKIYSFSHDLFISRTAKKEILEQLKTLSTEERDVFLFCLAKNQKTVRRNINDGPINSLASKRLINMASRGSVLAMPYTIPKFVWDHLKKKESELFPELFDIDAR